MSTQSCLSLNHELCSGSRRGERRVLVVAMKVEVELKLKLRQEQARWEGEGPELRVVGAGVAHSSAAQQLEGSCRTGIVTHAETLQQQQQQQQQKEARGGNSERRKEESKGNLTCLWTARVFGYAKGQNQHQHWRTTEAEATLVAARCLICTRGSARGSCRTDSSCRCC